MLNKIYFNLLFETFFFDFLRHIKMNLNLEIIKMLIIEDMYSRDAIYYLFWKVSVWVGGGAAHNCPC